MKTILIPTDFSTTAKNAAFYALGIAKQFGMDRIVLYNAYQAPVSVDPMVPTVQLLDMDLMKKSSEEGLADFKAALVKAGVEASRVTAKGYGSSQSISDNKTKASRDQNRRVTAEISTTVTKKK